MVDVSVNKEFYKGGCHCGAVQFEFTVPKMIKVLRCNCSLCHRIDFLHIIVPHAELKLLSDEAELQPYRFNTGAAEHLFCRICGIKSFYQPRSHPDCWSVNARCVDDLALGTLPIIDFDGRDWSAARQQLKE